MRIVLLFIPISLAQNFVPIERDSTTISPPVAHARREFMREFPQPKSVQREPSRTHREPVRTVQAVREPVEQEERVVVHRGRDHRRKQPHRVSPEEAAYLRRLEAWEEQREHYKEAVQAQKDDYYRQYFDRMRGYAIETHVRRYNQMIAQQAAERARFQKTMGEFGVREEDVIRQIGPDATATERAPTNPFGDARNAAEARGAAPSKAHAVPVMDSLMKPQRPSANEPRPENRDVHRKAAALEALCAKFMPTVRKHCFGGNRTDEKFVGRCAAYFHDCAGFLPQADPLYDIAHAFSSNVGLNLGTVGVKGIPYYPINEEGAIEVGREMNVPFGSWGGGYSDHIGVRDYWSQYQEAGANWYEGKYGYKSGWSVPLVQSLGIEGDTHAVVSVPIKPGELGKPIGVDVGGGVGPYYQQNQHVGVDYMNGQVGTNFGVGVPFAGVGVNTGVGVSFPSINDILG